jgi:hypothetical protein
MAGSQAVDDIIEQGLKTPPIKRREEMATIISVKTLAFV